MTAQQNKSPATLKLENEMAQCIGTEHYYKYCLGNLLYTDGVKHFCENAEAYWFLDTVFSHLVRMPDDFYTITLKVNDDMTATLYIKGEQAKKTQNIPFTDCPAGEWKFYFSDRVLIWNGEY